MVLKDDSWLRSSVFSSWFLRTTADWGDSSVFSSWFLWAFNWSDVGSLVFKCCQNLMALFFYLFLRVSAWFYPAYAVEFIKGPHTLLPYNDIGSITDWNIWSQNLMGISNWIDFVTAYKGLSASSFNEFTARLKFPVAMIFLSHFQFLFCQGWNCYHYYYYYYYIWFFSGM